MVKSYFENKTLCIKKKLVNLGQEEVKKKTSIKIAIQINGKTKEIIQIEDKISKEEVLEIVKNNNKIKKNLNWEKCY